MISDLHGNLYKIFIRMFLYNFKRLVRFVGEGKKGDIKKGKIQLDTSKLESRSNVVTTRIDDEDMDLVDILVEVDVFKSRSEAAAYFITEGIKAKKDFILKFRPMVSQIRKIKKQAKMMLKEQD